jgi:hypothetical protein
MSRIATRPKMALRFLALTLGAASAGCYLVQDKPEPEPPCDPTIFICDGTGRDPNATPDPGDRGGYPGDPADPRAGGTGGRESGPGAAADAPLPRAPAPPAACPAVPVSRFKELMIIDPAVTADPRADDLSAYRPWSFRQRIEALVPGVSAEAAGPLADAWLAQWSGLRDVPASVSPGATRIPIEPRPAADDVLRCPWLHQSPENGCDVTCTACRTRRADLGRSPFRLLAIVNRADLGATTATAACGAGASGGELRFVYGAFEPGTMRALPFTVIFEYAITLRAGETLRDWAAAWHDLGAPAPSAGYNARLDLVVSSGLARAALRRVLTNEVAFGAADGLPWEMRQFVPALTDAGTVRLVEVATSGTPRLTLASSPDLGQWIDSNAAPVLAGENPLPPTLLAASAPIPTADFAWRTTARDAAAGAAFNRNSCSGCHGGRTDPADVPFQHVAPPTNEHYGAGTGPGATARLSRFLHDPGRDDELGRRERSTATVLCTPCAGY